MPTYEYKCDACEHEFVKEQRITEKPSKKCPKCGKMKARRMISLGQGFILTGGGWEADLYSGSSNKDSGSKESKSTEKSTESKSTESKSDSTSSKSDSTSSKSTETKSKTKSKSKPKSD